MLGYDYDYIFKIVVVGESGVGKTSLVQRYVDNTFKTEQMSTVGIDFAIKTLTIRGKSVKLQVWDTAGQERFRVVSKQYYRGSSAFIFVYDMSKPDTLAALSDWIKEVQTVAESCDFFCLVGNKQDLFNDEDKGAAFAKANGMTYIKTSAKTGFQVEELMENIANKLVGSLEDNKVPYSEPFPKPTPVPPPRKKIKPKKDFPCCSLM